MSADPGRLPVAIFAGLHADARRTAVEKILRTVPGAVVLHHDLTDATARCTARCAMLAVSWAGATRPW